MTVPDGTDLRVTAVVCAYTERRFDDLVAALDSLDAQTRRPDDVLLVVDHNPALARRARAHFPSSVAVVENAHRQGLSGARNTALDLVGTSGGHPDGNAHHVVAFLDDDAAARPDWLARILAPYADPAVMAVGGAAAPRWPDGTTSPAVLPAELWWVVGCSYPGQSRSTVDGGATGAAGHPAPGPSEVRNLMGCAMSFRRTAFDAAGTFTEDMGRVGTVPLGCEETELCIRLRRAVPGARIVLDPDAVVDHHVSPDRTGWSYLVRRAVAEGLSKAVLARRWGAADGLSAERSYTRHVLPAALMRELRSAGRAARRREVGATRERLTAAAAVPVALGAAGWGYARGRTGRTGRTRPTGGAHRAVTS